MLNNIKNMRIAAFTVAVESSDVSHTFLKDIKEEEKMSQHWTGQMEVTHVWSITDGFYPF